MKMFYGGAPVKSMKVKHYEMNTNDCSAIPSDLQAGVTCVSKGQKITGTGKSFEFAKYGTMYSNFPIPVDNVINIIEISSTVYPIVMNDTLFNINHLDFSVLQTIGAVIVDGVNYPLSAVVENNILTIVCDKSISLEVFCGKDNYI